MQKGADRQTNREGTGRGRVRERERQSVSPSVGLLFGFVVELLFHLAAFECGNTVWQNTEEKYATCTAVFRPRTTRIQIYVLRC